ncbi:MAG: nucleotidyl transferase AbiEii/AbiGii toxin family protein [Cellvibrio sp.]|uniref:nucleotidyl transferase AbiEii/AbiGii toxin family protein n=1 Tax=Cellvibrio sp. TaxID=1965322 RepID=UPI00271583D1|nr:nucleotidyl transferase AbiEii/AbiGii toxin family protein [Cellvibrio sp.]
MAFTDVYRKQVELLVRTIPTVAEEKCFALKGGTAINLFIRNMPRLSVDIDLTYLPVNDRAKALQEIDAALKRIAQRIRSKQPDVHIAESAPATQKEITKLVIRTRERVQIKIEVTPVLRGCVYEPVLMPVCRTVEEQFGFAEMNVLSFADLYAGKIMAALDRQHPRDLFDVHHLLENEGISDELRNAIIIYLISHDHSPHSLLNPVLQDITQDFEQNFMGMTDAPIELSTLLNARQKLITNITSQMPEHHKQFLRSFYSRKPEWDLLGITRVQHLPAVRWRELNLDRSGEGTKETLLEKLAQVIGR